jgi:hypothetical protein
VFRTGFLVGLGLMDQHLAELSRALPLTKADLVLKIYREPSLVEGGLWQ